MSINTSTENTKLIYFNRRVLGETVRFILEYGGVQFEDVRVEFEQWPELKPSIGWGKLPVIQFGNVELTQSAAICRYFARKFGLVGETDFDAAKCDEYVDCLKDFRQEWRLYWFETDETKKSKQLELFQVNALPKYLGKFNEIVEKNGGNWLVGRKETWADFWFVIFIDLFEITVDKNILQDYPALVNLKKNILSIPSIRNWVARRPNTPF